MLYTRRQPRQETHGFSLLILVCVSGPGTARDIQPAPKLHLGMSEQPLQLARQLVACSRHPKPSVSGFPRHLPIQDGGERKRSGMATWRAEASGCSEL